MTNEGPSGDFDGSPTKCYMLKNKDPYPNLYQLADPLPTFYTRKAALPQVRLVVIVHRPFPSAAALMLRALGREHEFLDIPIHRRRSESIR